jgi:hypothetical protein
MKFWWVSQNQTFDHEVPGGYMWSPKVNRDDSTNHFYETMREVARGDIVFSFCSRKIMAIGIVQRPAYTCPKPQEFGSAGANWNEVGWRVEVQFKVLLKHIEPRQHMELLRPLLPERYSPIRADGTGNQIYLAELPDSFGQALLGLIGLEGQAAVQESETHSKLNEEATVSGLTQADTLYKWDGELERIVDEDPDLTITEKEQVVKARRGQGLFKSRVTSFETCCRVTKVNRPEHLVASHIKPWRVSENRERLDGENGLLLTPSIDHLFDGGFISFKDSGELVLSNVADRPSLIKMGIPQLQGFNAGTFTRKQTEYLEYHRDLILLQARG